MARSLTVTHDEKPATNPLFTAFILVAVLWLVMSALAPAPASSPPGSTAQDLPAVDVP